MSSPPRWAWAESLRVRLFLFQQHFSLNCCWRLETAFEFIIVSILSTWTPESLFLWLWTPGSLLLSLPEHFGACCNLSLSLHGQLKVRYCLYGQLLSVIVSLWTPGSPLLSLRGHQESVIVSTWALGSLLSCVTVSTWTPRRYCIYEHQGVSYCLDGTCFMRWISQIWSQKLVTGPQTLCSWGRQRTPTCFWL